MPYLIGIHSNLVEVGGEDKYLYMLLGTDVKCSMLGYEYGSST